MLSELTGNEIATLLIPTTVTLVTARDEAGNDKVATIAWAMPVSHDPSLIAVAIRPEGQTAEAMVDGDCFVVNVLGEGSADIAMICGKKHGVVDRFAEAHLTRVPAKRVNATRVKEAISWIECRFMELVPCGDHDIIIGATQIAETRGSLDERGKLVPEPALLMGQRGVFGRFVADE